MATGYVPIQAKRVKVYKNGDATNGRTVVVNRRNIKDFETFLEACSKALKTPVPVRRIATIGGEKVADLEELKGQEEYIAITTGKLQLGLQYGKIISPRRDDKNKNGLVLPPVYHNKRLIVSGRARKISRATCRIFVYPNGKFSEESNVLLQMSNLPTMGRVLDALAEHVRLSTAAAIRHLYAVDTYEEVKDPRMLENGQKYVAVGVEKVVKHGNYGQRPPPLNLSTKVENTKHQKLPPIKARSKKDGMNSTSGSEDGKKSEDEYRTRHKQKKERKEKENEAAIPTKPVSHKRAAKDKKSKNGAVTFNPETGMLRFYIRGRPISLHAPTNCDNYELDQVLPAPEETLKLEWVYGYRGKDCRSNMFYLPSGELVYHMAAVAVLYNVQTKTQRHYLDHTDDIKCLAVHPDQVTIVTGQVEGHAEKQGQPHVRIWSSDTLETLHVIGLKDFEIAVACVAFSRFDGGELLAAFDDDNDHTLLLYDWKNEKKLLQQKSCPDPICEVEFHPMENTVVACGKQQVLFFEIEDGQADKKMGLFEDNERPAFVVCLTFAENGDVVTGDTEGNIFVWSKDDRKVIKAIHDAHEGPVFGLARLPDGSFVSGGGKDGKIWQWDAEYNKQDLETQVPEDFGPVRILEPGPEGSIFIGTTENAIVQGVLGQLAKFDPLTQGHSDELWGIAVHPHNGQILTCAYDKHVYMWDPQTHALLWSKQLQEEAHSACIHPDGEVAVIGTRDAKWLVLDLLQNGQVIFEDTDGKEQIECVEFSPDGSRLAVGSRDNSVYLYNVTDSGHQFDRIGRCTGHSSYITHLDWSMDGQYIQTNSGDYELLYWDASTGDQIPSAQHMRDVEWATQYCTLSFNTLGLWPEDADGTDVNGCSRATRRAICASGDDDGKVNLFKYPANQKKSGSHVYGGHSSHVTATRFLTDDSGLFSTGGRDMAVLQWRVQ
ncbi:echinoderm microtubule-associated protein-like 2 isoform X2 [Lingula anatina]|uniref:Echinoderm microtubule-associated protein-like 2 isoform X2 n=1 Tax=Lingula anatina TaxID=7574 RepID=A0A1S3INK4_LINAN|nr:echinoderm microtubule-associated protein-like 2 isoform X2 [Lingula anatina]|eukprot:XP_013399114.1 echinoderm microtubule-associated protein-like 2 isoform X2 [Lingula anatina]